MLKLTISGQELYDEITETFSTVGEVIIELEHSLLSLSKWESKHEVSFLSSKEKTAEQIMDYIVCMVVSSNFSEELLKNFSQENLEQINAYINSNQSATTFGEMPARKGRGETITAELIYYWLVAYNIPLECQTWHLNRLFALVRICNVKNEKPKKMSRNEIASRNRELNAQRKEKLNTSG